MLIFRSKIILLLILKASWQRRPLNITLKQTNLPRSGYLIKITLNIYMANHARWNLLEENSWKGFSSNMWNTVFYSKFTPLLSGTTTSKNITLNYYNGFHYPSYLAI